MKNTSNYLFTKRNEKGFTLIEIMVSMLLVGIGLLGYAGLLNITKKNTASSFLRTQATILGFDILERMRANRAYVVKNPSHYSTANIPSYCSNQVETIVYREDLRQFACLMKSSLPIKSGGVQASIVFNPSTKIVNIKIVWDDSRGTSGSDHQEFNLESRL